MLDNKFGTEYTPKARPPGDDKSFWEKLRSEEVLRVWLELDLYGYTAIVVKSFIDEDCDNGTALRNLRQIAISRKYS